MDLMGMVGVGPAGPRGGAPHRRPQAAAAARRAAPCGPGLVACRGWPRRRRRAAGRAVRQDGPGGRSPSAPGEAGAPAARGPVDAEMCRGAGNCYRKVNSVPGRFPGGERCGIMGSKNAGEPMLPLVLEPKRKAFYGDLDFLPRPDAGRRGMERKKGGNSL